MKMIRMALALVAAVFIGSAAWAEGANTSSVTLEKSIASTDRNNATIRIVPNIKFSDVVQTNKILLVGSMCGSHGLTPKVVRGTINALAHKGEVLEAVRKGLKSASAKSDDLFKIGTAQPVKWLIANGVDDMEFEGEKKGAPQFFALRVDKIDEEAGK